MKRPQANIVSLTESGYWRVIVDPVPQTGGNKSKKDVTVFRGGATMVSSLSTTDPFGPATATISFPAITVFDALGTGDLDWCVPEANVDIMWMSSQVDASSATVWEPSTAYLTNQFVIYNGLNYKALTNIDAYVYSVWNRFDDFVVGDIVIDNGIYYKCILNRAHTTNTPHPVADKTHWQVINVTPDKATDKWLYFEAAGKPLYTWEGYFLAFEFGEDDAGGTLTITCNGAMRQMDNFLAKPEYLTHPISYENAIARQFDSTLHPSIRLKNIKPLSDTLNQLDWWETIYSVSDYKDLSNFYRPVNIKDKTRWTGLLTRSTGNFEPVLTTYVQGLLSTMQTTRGSFTVLLGTDRRPYFKHRERLHAPANETLVVDLLWPGVQVSISQDYSQRLNVVYGNGQSLSGYSYSNIKVSADGSTTYYEPFAARPQVYPALDTNVNWDPNKMAKEVSLQFYSGLDTDEATAVARKHLEMFTEPGVTGTLTLKTDPLVNGVLLPRQTIVAGMSLQLLGLFGDPNGMVFHITETSYSEDNTVSITFDSKFRDQLTVQEIRKRGRDSMVVNRVLGVGRYAPSIPDLLFPWTYEKPVYSGFVPQASGAMWSNAVTYGNIPNNIAYPWTKLTTAYPPSQSGHENMYAKIDGPSSINNADANWSDPVVVNLAVTGQVIASQFVALKADGSIYKVPFHVSIWYQNVDVLTGMPILPTASGADTFSTTITDHALVTSTATASGGAYTLTFVTPSAHGLKVGDNVIVMPDPAPTIDGLLTPTYYIVDTVVGTKTFTVHISTSAITLAEAKTLKKGEATYAKQFVGLAKYVVGKKDSVTGLSYQPGQYYPFFEGAWENNRPDGTVIQDPNVVAKSPPIAAWGTYYQKAGYWPASSPSPERKDATVPTGKFWDETPFSFDFKGTSIVNVSQYEAFNPKLPDAARVAAYVMFYCDEEWSDSQGKLIPRTEDVYFLGRLYHQPPTGQ